MVETLIAKCKDLLRSPGSAPLRHLPALCGRARERAPDPGAPFPSDGRKDPGDGRGPVGPAADSPRHNGSSEQLLGVEPHIAAELRSSRGRLQGAR